MIQNKRNSKKFVYHLKLKLIKCYLFVTACKIVQHLRKILHIQYIKGHLKAYSCYSSIIYIAI